MGALTGTLVQQGRPEGVRKVNCLLTPVVGTQVQQAMNAFNR